MRKLAKYYIYRNLHTNTFSVKYRGKVILHPMNIRAIGCSFKVNESGRQKVLQTKRKGVHAFVVCDEIEVLDRAPKANTKVYYNPYLCSSFMLGYEPIHTISEAFCVNGKSIFIE